MIIIIMPKYEYKADNDDNDDIDDYEVENDDSYKYDVYRIPTCMLYDVWCL